MAHINSYVRDNVPQDADSIVGTRASNNQTVTFTMLAIKDYLQLSLVFDQITPSTSWVINHNLNRFPSVSVVDTANTQIFLQVVYNNANQITLTATPAVAGRAFLN